MEGSVIEAVLARLRAALGEAHVLHEAADTAPYCTDWRGRYRGDALCVVRPASVAEVAAVVRVCTEAGVAMVPQGGNTGLCGGATPRSGRHEVVVNLSRLNRVRALDADNASITVEAGCKLAAVQAAAREAGLLFPLSLASEGSCEIGGNLSTNAGGVHVLRHGNAREQVLGLEVVLPDGRIWDGLRSLRKDNTGYDLKQLFIGAEGTLGFITAAVLRLRPLPACSALAWVALPDVRSAIALLRHLQAHAGDALNAFELVGRDALDLVLRHIPGTRDPLSAPHPWYVLIELAGAEQGGARALEPVLESVLDRALENALVADAVIAQDGPQASALWALRENISEAQRIEGFSVKHDISVPVSAIPAFTECTGAALGELLPGVRIVAFGHAGDGNLHYNLSFPDAADNAALLADAARASALVHDTVQAFAGSISAEHGIGQLKRDLLPRYKSEVELDMMRAIKSAFDPRDLMNPGKVLPSSF
ncbi:FAD-binding oxidoreductase [Methyloversatilis thermotolerans]|uniref:FAD-binding oxidoreductase n=1 Tax=Methyloversatilis thermotolerans TaxID=1346290 RepID=UPI000376088F|nr:FAD-binding oxidoreductase [Methyloversatilis thermotolerans]